MPSAGPCRPSENRFLTRKIHWGDASDQSLLLCQESNLPEKRARCFCRIPALFWLGPRFHTIRQFRKYCATIRTIIFISDALSSSRRKILETIFFSKNAHRFAISSVCFSRSLATSCAILSAVSSADKVVGNSRTVFSTTPELRIFLGNSFLRAQMMPARFSSRRLFSCFCVELLFVFDSMRWRFRSLI